MSDAAPVDAEPIHGVSLEQFAGVSVALEEGLPLQAILAAEGIATDAWPKAESAWRVFAAKDAGAFTTLRAKRVVAEDCLARSVAPIESELAAWMSFLRAYGAHAAPFEMLESAGLHLNDLSRLQRRWTARIAEDPRLEKQAADLARNGLPPPSALRVAPAVLKPFPWTRRRASTRPEASARKASVAVPSDTRMAPGQLRFYAYVAIKARLAEHVGDKQHEERVLREAGMKDFATTDAEWRTIMASNPELERDYRRLFASNRSKLQSRPPASPASSEPVAPPMLAPTPAPMMPMPARAPNKLAGTAMAVETPHRPTLPFARPAPPRPPLAGTAMAVNEPHKAALPFASARPSEPPGPPDAPSLTLEQHASLVAEIGLAPEHALDALARYRITPAEKAAADRHYGERFAREPGLRERWEDAKRRYAEYLAAQKVNR